MRLSEKLAALFAAAALLPLITASIFVLREVSSSARARAVEQLQTSGRAAASIYEKRLGEMRSAAQQLADEIANRALVSGGDAERDSATAWTRLQDMLPRAQKELSLDFLIVTDPAGRVIARHNDRPRAGETLLASDSKNLIAEKVIADGSQLRNSPTAAAAIERTEQVARLGLETVARIERPDGSAVGEALMIEAGAPIFSAGRFVGMALIGQMLNTYYSPRAGASSLQTPLVAEARQTLFRGADVNAGVLVALDDTVVASSLPLSKSNRGAGSEPALKGIRRNAAKTDEVLSYGDAGYAVSWQPIKSLDGMQVGAIGVAVPATELEGSTTTVRVMLIVIGLLGIALAATAGFFLGRTLASRVTALTEASHRMSVGELSAPVKDPAAPKTNWITAWLSKDEISRLADQMDYMRESFRQAIERMRKR